MKLPFTQEQFLEVFKHYNTQLFPVQIFFLLLAASVIYFVARASERSGKFIFIILGFLWIWMGAVYHIGFFSAINEAAIVFGALFFLEGVLLLIYAFRPTRFSLHKNLTTVTSVALLAYSLIVYPILGHLAGHDYPYSPTFGLPCPTTIFTLAILLLVQNKLPFYIVVIPLLWTVIGFSAAFSLGIYEDAALIVSGLVFVFLNSAKTKASHAAGDHTIT